MATLRATVYKESAFAKELKAAAERILLEALKDLISIFAESTVSAINQAIDKKKA